MSKPQPKTEYWSLKEYAAVRGVSVGTVRRWISARKVGAEQPYGDGGRWFIRRDAAGK